MSADDRFTGARVEALEPRRMFSSGQLDLSFDDDGVITTGDSLNSEAGDVLLQPDGKIVTLPGYVALAVRRFTADGARDPSFGSGGVASSVTSGYSAHGLLQPDGKIVIVGPDLQLGGYRPTFAAARLNSDGSPDPSFGYGGIMPLDNASINGVQKVFFLPNGKLLLVGSVADVLPDGSSTVPDLAILRLNSDGSPDAAFGSGGVMRLDVRPGTDLLADAILQPENKLVVALQAQSDRFGVAPPMLIRLTNAGQLDPTFGLGGRVDLTGPSGNPVGDDALYVTRLALRADGGIVASGYSDSHYAVVEFHANGSLDTGFGDAGRANLGRSFSVGALAVRRDGAIRVVGITPYVQGATGLVVVGLKPDGSMMSSFGLAGIGLSSSNQIGNATAAIVEPDGALLVGGTGWLARVQDEPLEAPAGVFGATYDDRNDDGRRNPGEPPLVGKVVFDDLDDDGAFDVGEPSTTTQADGTYALTGLPTGKQFIRVASDGWAQTEPIGGTSYVFTLAQGERASFKDFGLTNLPNATASFAGSVYVDENDNGRQEPDEGPFVGLPVYLDVNDNSRRDEGEPVTRTDDQGRYLLSGLASGAHIFRYDLPSGWRCGGTNVEAAYYLVLQPGTTFGGVHDGFTRKVQISGTMWDDVNENGTRDFNPEGLEPTVAYRTVYLDLNDNGQLDSDEPSQQANYSGWFFFGDLIARTYVVRQVLPPGVRQTFPATDEGHVLAMGEGAVADVSFGSTDRPVNGSISGGVYIDADRDGTPEIGLPLAGRTVYIDSNGNGGLDAGEISAVSANDGTYLLPDVPPGAQVVRQVLPADWEQSHPAGGNGETVDVVGRGIVADGPKFGSFRHGHLTGVVYNDHNGNQRRDPGDEGIAGWRVYVDLDSDGTLGPNEPVAETNSDGVYHFNDVFLGRYDLRVIPQPGWYSSLTRLGFSAEVGLFTDPDPQTVPETQSAVIVVGVFDDVNGTGKRDGPDHSLGDWTVYADLNDNGALDAGEPVGGFGPDNAFYIGGLAGGTYIIRQKVNDGYAATAPAAGFYTVTAKPGEATAPVYFGASRFSRLGGYVFNDVNSDNRLQLNEPRLAGQVVYIDANNNGALDSGERTTVTEANGYQFDGLLPGDYTLRLVVPHGFRQAVPSAGAGLHFNLWDDGFSLPQVFGMAVERAPVSIRTQADAWVADGERAGLNFGNAAGLFVGRYYSTGENREAYLRFSLRDLNAVESATLKLSGLIDLGAAPGLIEVYGADDVGWSEGGITWNNRPPADAVPLGAVTVADRNRRLYEVDVTDYLRARKAAGASAVTFVLRAAGDHPPLVSFASREQSLDTAELRVVQDIAAPGVSAIQVAGSSWKPGFLDALRDADLGDGGFAVPASDAAPLPWANLDQVTVRFTEDVIVARDALRLRGRRIADYAIRDFDYDVDAHTATWTLSIPFAADDVSVDLSGSTDLAGNGLAGERGWEIRSLPADVDRSGGAVNAADLVKVRNRVGRSTANLGIGDNAYSVFTDVNGDGVVNAADLVLVRNRVGTSLPAVPPSVVFSGSRIAPAERGRMDEVEAAVL